MFSFTAKILVSLKFAGSVFQNSLPCYSSPHIISQESVQTEKVLTVLAFSILNIFKTQTWLFWQCQNDKQTPPAPTG